MCGALFSSLYSLIGLSLSCPSLSPYKSMPLEKDRQQHFKKRDFFSENWQGNLSQKNFILDDNIR